MSIHKTRSERARRQGRKRSPNGHEGFGEVERNEATAVLDLAETEDIEHKLDFDALRNATPEQVFYTIQNHSDVYPEFESDVARDLCDSTLIDDGSIVYGIGKKDAGVTVTVSNSEGDYSFDETVDYVGESIASIEDKVGDNLGHQTYSVAVDLKQVIRDRGVDAVVDSMRNAERHRVETGHRELLAEMYFGDPSVKSGAEYNRFINTAHALRDSGPYDSTRPGWEFDAARHIHNNSVRVRLGVEPRYEDLVHISQDAKAARIAELHAAVGDDLWNWPRV